MFFSEKVRVLCIFCAFLCACSNSVAIQEKEQEETVTVAEGSDGCKDVLLTQKEEFIEDFKNSYRGIPRVGVVTECNKEILDRETEIPAIMLVCEDSLAQCQTMTLTIRGRGNSSWDEMPKHSFKMNLAIKQGLLGMPENRDWALISNYADKTLMKNYLAYRLAADIGMEYSPRCKFVELYLNGEYQGVYLLTETVKVGKNRVNIPQKNKSYLVEFDEKYKADEQVVFSDVLAASKPFRIHHPKNASDTVLNALLSRVQSFEKFLMTVDSASLDEIESWIDVDAFAKHFWIQELAKNPDANYLTSVYFTWVEGGAIKMGPVWDFDLAFAGFGAWEKELALSSGWRTKDEYWSKRLFSNEEFEKKVGGYWETLRPSFERSIFILDSLYEVLERPADENFSRWDILQKGGKWLYRGVESYEKAVVNLKDWIVKRMDWIDKNGF